MYRMRPRPSLGPDVGSRTPHESDIRKHRPPKFGLIIVVFCTILSFDGRHHVLGSTTPPYNSTTDDSSTTAGGTTGYDTTATTTTPAPVISGTQCSSGGDCDAIFGPGVVCGTSGFCDCDAADLVPVGDRCRHKCVAEARQLHDKGRRKKNYKNAIGEPAVRDNKIKEGWYSLDQYRLMGGAETGNLTGGSCGTRYQIMMKDGSTVTWDSLDLNEVTLTATVYGRPEGHGEDLEIRVRKCEDAFQYYLKPPSIRLAAYCFDSSETNQITDEEDPLTIPSSTYLTIDTSLNFREELREGQWFDVPFVIWTCKMEDHNSAMRDIFPEIQFISISWFADNTRIQSTEPQPIMNDPSNEYNNRRVWAAANLTEDDLLAAGLSPAVVIRCGAQVSRSATGKLSSMSTTYVDTRMHAYATEGGTSENSDKLILHVNNNIPLGCAAPVDTEEKSCVMKLRVIRDEGTLVCSDDITDEHELCGITLTGRTRNGEYPPRHYTNENGTSIYESKGVYIQLESASEELDRSAALYVSLAVINNAAGHALWDNYHIHNVMIDLPEKWTEDQGFYHFSLFQSSRNNISHPIANMYGLHPLNPEAEFSGYLPIEEAGKYIILWSGKFPFMFEAEIEPTVDGDLYVCGAYLRYGNDIYAYSYCGGVFIDGLIFGNGYYLPETNNGYINLREIGLTMDSQVSEGHLSIYFHSSTGFQLEVLEGFCSFDNRGMIGRHGNVYTDDSAEFLGSWRIDESESLANPENHIFYSLESKYSTCVCPAETDDIPEREETYTSKSQINYNVYIGALHCNLDEICTDVTIGEIDWPTSLRPDYMIEEVKIRCEQSDNGSGKPLLRITCQFKSVQNKLYTVKWYIDDAIFLSIDAATNEADFSISDDEIYVVYGANFVLDMKIQCSVSVLDDGLNELIAPIMSEVFEPIHFESTDINIQRGGDGTITWTNYIPFFCNAGNSDCDMELQFFVSNDSYDCEDSTLAIKTDDNCGGRVQATDTISATTGTETTTTITTKNNDKYELKTNFELRVMVIFHGAGKSYWTHLARIVFAVRVVDEVFWIGMSCHLHVDPHGLSFDGKNYEMQYIGLFVLARHLYLPIQIQVITMSCWESWGGWPSPTCACALIFQAGLDVYLIDHCNGAHFNGFLLAGDDVLEVYQRGDTRYKIVFPDTMAADIYVMPSFNYFMNVDIYPSPAEKHNMVGLCGNFNGDTSDDFQIRDTTTQGDREDFSMSWELHETAKVEAESLLEEANYQNPTPWNNQQKLCVCPNAYDAVNTPSSPLCSANEEQTCTKSKSHKGNKLNHGTRPKRDTGGYVNLDIQKRVSRLKRNIFEQHTIHRKKRGAVSGANRMNETVARRVCESKFAESSISNVTGKLISDEQYINDCVFDLMASGDEEWAKPQITLLTTRNEVAIQKNDTFARNNQQVVEAMEKICTHDCNGHGNCTGNDECNCDPGWGRKSCLLDLSVVPVISYITGGGKCDPSVHECWEFIIETNGLADRFFAQVVALEATNQGAFVMKEEFTTEVVPLSLNEAVIDVTTGRRRRSTSPDPVLASQYGVSISNDGVNFGNATYVTVLDTRCQETTNNSNGDTIVVLVAGSCFIDGVCYSEGNTSAASSCQICRTATSVFDWTEENCPTTTTPTPSKDDSLPLYVIIFSVTGGVVVVIVIAGILYLKHIQKRRPVTPLPAPPPYPGPAPVGPMNLRFYLKGVDGQPLESNRGQKWRY